MSKRLILYLKSGELQIDTNSIVGHVYVLSPYQVKKHKNAKEIRKARRYLTTDQNCGYYYIQLEEDELEFFGLK